MTTAPDVLALQETDQALDRARARLTDVEAQMGESEELIAIRQDVAVREEVLMQLRSRLHDAESFRFCPGGESAPTQEGHRKSQLLQIERLPHGRRRRG